MKKFTIVKKNINNKGMTLIELVIYIGLLILLLSVLSSIFSAIVDVQLNSNSTSSVDQDGTYILAKFNHDVASSSAMLVPATPGSQSATLQLTVNSINYSYSINTNNNLQILNGSTSQTDVLNSYNTSVSGLSFTRIGNGGNSDTVEVSFTVKSKIEERSGKYESKSFQTTLGED
jgi:type II secretory pathway pseudopilin PulG